jgi:pimeloyl-ACP methyl ester carboxylesterase
MPLQAKQIVINNLLISYYQQTTEKAQPVLLFLHGWRSEGKIWQKVIEKLPEYSIYALDLPGFGKSQTPPDFSLQDYADVVDEFIKKLDLKNIIIIGHSHGGRTAIKLAASQPEYLEKIVLVDSAGIHPDSIVRTGKKIIAKIVKPIFILSFLQPLRRKIYTALGSDDYLVTPELRSTFLNIIHEDITTLLPKIKQPALLIWGDRDKDTPLEQAHIMERNVPGSKLIVLQGAGHYSFLDKTEEFIEELKKFI